MDAKTQSELTRILGALTGQWIEFQKQNREFIRLIEKITIQGESLTEISTTQENQLTEITNINYLTQSITEINSRLAVLAGMANSGAPALRVAPISSVSTAVTGSLTTVTNLTNFGTGIPASEMAHDMNNLVAVIANVNNVIVSP